LHVVLDEVRVAIDQAEAACLRIPATRYEAEKVSLGSTLAVRRRLVVRRLMRAAGVRERDQKAGLR
jgi:hypothetical protein